MKDAPALVILIICLFFTLFPAGAGATSGVSFDTWLSRFKGEARAAGISESTLTTALNGISPVRRVIELDRKQPEWKKTFAEYKRGIVSADRISRGRQLMNDYSQTLSDIEARTGVPKSFIVALWAIETNYGTNTGGFQIIPALATLAWEGRRASFFKDELIKALKIIDQGHITAADMKGSWAGAMGQNQFMPSSFLAFAVDYNGDGHKDIWKTRGDVFASTANYLMQSGWKSGQRWGRRVLLPQSFPHHYVKNKNKMSVNDWARLGVKDITGENLPSDQTLGQIVAPDGVTGEAYLVYDNYQVIMKWNRSTYFATSVGLLADALSR